MKSYLIADTTREEREQIVEESLGNIAGACDGCMAGLAEMYQDYIDGKKEIREINMEFNARPYWGQLVHRSGVPVMVGMKSTHFCMLSNCSSSTFAFP